MGCDPIIDGVSGGAVPSGPSGVTEFEDFVTSSTAFSGWSPFSTGGASVTISGVNVTGARPGQIRLRTSSTASDTARMTKGNNNGYLAGLGEWRWGTDVRPGGLYDVATPGMVACGMADATLFTTSVDFIGFTYSDASANWFAQTIDSGAPTVTDTGVAVVDADWNRLEWIVAGDASSVSFLVGGAVVATHVTNIPSAGTNALGYLFTLERTGAAGVANVDMYLDWVQSRKVCQGR